MIKVVWLRPRKWGLTWQKSTRMFYLGLYFVGIRIDFGKKYRDGVISKRIGEVRAFFNKNCLVCLKPLNVVNYGQRVFYHGECRKKRHD